MDERDQKHREVTSFQSFGKIPRLSRDMIITEKLDGTNAQILITEYGDVIPGSRNRFISPQDDNYGFGAWVHQNKEEILKLGLGRHFGEWWGKGINRNYGLNDRRFSLFNTKRWAAYGTTPKIIPNLDPKIVNYQDVTPECVGVVPVLYKGEFDTERIDLTLDTLKYTGSHAAPGFMNPEGIIIFHTASNYLFKKTIHGDDVPKTSQK